MTPPAETSDVNLTGRRSNDGVHAFLGRFARALAGGDVETVADAWHLPSLVIGDQSVLSFSHRDEVERFFSASTREYDGRGVLSERVRVLRLERVGERMASVQIQWPYLDRDEREAGEETVTYTLRRGDDGRWKICSALMQGATSRAR